MRDLGRNLYLFIGWASLALAVIGTLMPIMPTVPFLIVAFWAFSKSSPELSRRILAHPRLGPPLRDWLRHGAIPRRVRYLTALAMVWGCGLAWLLGAPAWLLGTQITVCTLVAAYVLTRPDPPAAG